MNKFVILLLVAAFCQIESSPVINLDENEIETKDLICWIPGGSSACNLKCQIQNYTGGKCNDYKCECYNSEAPEFVEQNPVDQHVNAQSFEPVVERMIQARDVTCLEGGNKDCFKQCVNLGWSMGQCYNGDCRCQR